MTLGFVWGVMTGDWASSLGVSLFFELLWLDIFPAGTIIPPQSLAPALASLATMQHFSATKPALAAVVMLFSLPLGRMFAQLERFHRQFENEDYNRLMNWAKIPTGSPGPASLTRRAIISMFLVNSVVFAAALACLMVVMGILMPRFEPLLESIPLKWPHLWVVASIGAILSLRHRPAYAILLAGVVLAVLSRVVG